MNFKLILQKKSRIGNSQCHRVLTLAEFNIYRSEKVTVSVFGVFVWWWTQSHTVPKRCSLFQNSKKSSTINRLDCFIIHLDFCRCCLTVTCNSGQRTQFNGPISFEFVSFLFSKIFHLSLWYTKVIFFCSLTNDVLSVLKFSIYYILLPRMIDRCVVHIHTLTLTERDLHEYRLFRLRSGHTAHSLVTVMTARLWTYFMIRGERMVDFF